MSRAPRGRGVRELLLALCAFVASLFVLELGARLLLPPTRYHEAALAHDPELGFRGIPNTRYEVQTASGRHDFELNAEGFRGRELPRGAAAPDVQRIAFLGDSFLVAEQVPEEQVMTARLEEALRAGGREVEVYNLGVVDYGTAQQLLLLEQLAPRLEPDVVVLALYPGNDIVNNSLLLAGVTEVSPGDPIRPYLIPDAGRLRGTWLSPGRARLRGGSRLWSWFERRALMPSMEQSAPTRRTPRERLRSGRAPREHLELFARGRSDPDWERAWQTTFSLLRKLRDRVQALGARFLVLVIPTAYQVEHKALAVRYDVESRVFAHRPLDQLLDWNLPERRLAAFFAAEQIETLPLLTPLRGAAREGVVFSFDRHLNAEGHAVAARHLGDWLRSAPGARPGAPDGAPVHVLREHGGGQARLDFGAGRHELALGSGWIRWEAREDSTHPVWGWYIGPSALIALPALGDEVVVRGLLPLEARLPAAGRVGFVGSKSRRFTLNSHGSFEIRAPWPAGVRRDREGYAAVLIAPGQTHARDGLPLGFIVHEVALE